MGPNARRSPRWPRLIRAGSRLSCSTHLMSTMANPSSAIVSNGAWPQRWEPENASLAIRRFGARVAHPTITTLNLTMAFIGSFVSALVVRLPQIGFVHAPSELFWLAAMPDIRPWRARCAWFTCSHRCMARAVVVSLIAHPVAAGAAGRLRFTPFRTMTPYRDADALAFSRRAWVGQLFSAFDQPFFPKRLQGTALPSRALGTSVRPSSSLSRRVIGFSHGYAAFMGQHHKPDQGWRAESGSPAERRGRHGSVQLVFGISAWLLLKSVPVKANPLRSSSTSPLGPFRSMTSL